MPSKFADIAFTPAVKAAQTQRGSRETYERYTAKAPPNDTITPELAEFITQMDGGYLGTIGSNGYPYIQFRGGPPGFLKVLDNKTIGFADFSGNVQYITVGNLSENDKSFLFLMDYRHRRRFKLWGRAHYVENDPELIEQLHMPGYPAKIERAVLFTLEAFSQNCPQHIPVRYSEQDLQDAIEAATAPLQAKIIALENRLQG
ncbi:pyridoxamine 5'-phosphate oxidase family protein [Leptothoe sp. EHU-05/26/07-4]